MIPAIVRYEGQTNKKFTHGKCYEAFFLGGHMTEDQTKVRKMLDHLSFWCGGFFGADELITIKDQNACLTLDYYVFSRDYPRETFPHFHDEWTRERSKRWLSKFEEIHFELWEDKYWANTLDGEQWKLRYQYEGENEKEHFGSNAYPENWNQFRNLMTTLTHKLQRVEDAGIKEIIRLR